MSQAALKRLKAGQKSDDIISFILKHWKLFTTREEKQRIESLLGTDSYPYSVDTLCDLLGLPMNIYFKRVPLVDTAKTILHFDTSNIYKIFKKCKETNDGKEVCLFTVCGESTLIITDMQTYESFNQMHIYYKDEDGTDIQIIKAKDAQTRMPSLFTHNE